MQWIVSVAPSEDELRALEAKGFRRDDLLDAVDPRERSRVRVRGDDTLVVLRLARRPPTMRHPARTVPLAMLFGRERGVVVIATNGELSHRIEAAVGSGDTTPRRVIAAVLELVATDFLDQLQQIDETVEQIEARLEGSLANREVVALLRHQKTLLHFTVALDEMVGMLEQLQREPHMASGGEDEEWLADARVELRQALEVARLSSHGLGQMMSAFSSIIANDVNDAMKLLASIAVILTWPVFLASLYGMNVPLPGQSSRFACLVILAAAAVGCVLLAWKMHRRRWL